MSLAIIFKGSEGIVLAADSRVTLTVKHQLGPDSADTFLIPATYDNATKLLKINGHDYVAAVTYGAGAIGNPEPRTAHSLLPEFQVEGRPSVVKFAESLSTFFMEQWAEKMPSDYRGDPMFFMVGGYDEGKPYGRVFQFVVPTAPKPIEQLVDDFGLQYGGQQEIISRILNGFDEALVNLLKNKLSLKEQDVNTWLGDIRKTSASKIPYQFLPLQDCVDLAILLIRTTSQLLDYQTGIRGVGGAVDVAIITRQGKFQYVQRKEIRGEQG